MWWHHTTTTTKWSASEAFWPAAQPATKISHSNRFDFSSLYGANVSDRRLTAIRKKNEEGEEEEEVENRNRNNSDKESGEDNNNTTIGKLLCGQLCSRGKARWGRLRKAPPNLAGGKPPPLGFPEEEEELEEDFVEAEKQEKKVHVQVQIGADSDSQSTIKSHEWSQQDQSSSSKDQASCFAGACDSLHEFWSGGQVRWYMTSGQVSERVDAEVRAGGRSEHRIRFEDRLPQYDEATCCYHDDDEDAATALYDEVTLFDMNACNAVGSARQR